MSEMAFFLHDEWVTSAKKREQKLHLEMNNGIKWGWPVDFLSRNCIMW